MDYSQFICMVPEITLMLMLIVVFIADMMLDDEGKRYNAFYYLTASLLVVQCWACLSTIPGKAFGGLYNATDAANLMKAILTAGSAIVVMMAQPWLRRDSVIKREGEFYELIISTLLGMYIMMSSGHFLLFFLGLEMASVPMACLVAFDKKSRESAEGAAKFILMATFSSGVMLYGISFIYGAVGTLYFEDVAAAIQVSPLTIMGLVFFFSGLAFKISLVPFHFWTADSYQGAPTPVTGYLSVVSKGAAAFTLMVILTKVFGTLIEYWNYLLYITIVMSITVANLFAIRQRELKRFLAFSSISQAGYIMLAILGVNYLSMASLIYYILVYVVANLSVFAVICIVEQRYKSTYISRYNGFYKKNPKLAFLMTLALFSLAGIPPFAGMFSKFFVFMAAARHGELLAYVVLFVALINTVVSLYYYLLIVKAMYITPEDDIPEHLAQPIVVPTCCKLALGICTFGIVVFGVFSYIYDRIYFIIS